MKLVIFGARSIALGVCRAVMELYPDFPVAGFLVSSREGNPDTLAGLPVYEIGSFKQKDCLVLIATPEDVQEDIVLSLEAHGFHSLICVDSQKESALMERYYVKTGDFRSLHMLRPGAACPAKNDKQEG